MTKHNDALSILIRSCGPVIKDETTYLTRLNKRFDDLEEFHRDLEGRRRYFKRGLLFGFAFGIFSVLCLLKMLVSIT